MPELNEIPYDKKFDAIVLLAAFHHLENEAERRTCLETLKKFLTPNGSVYMTNWNLLDQEKYQKNHRGNGDFDIKIGEFSRYYHGFTIEELRELFVETGWKVVENRIFEGGRNIYSKISNI
jgi:cyclopropane fatty-acyl-phospholipid synthase-like methyltransferase